MNASTANSLLTQSLAKGIQLAFACCAGIATAQLPVSSSDLDAFKELRTSFQRRVLIDSQTLAEQFERALGRLEFELAESGDYDQAAQVKRRRIELQSLFQPSDSSIADSLAIPLSSRFMRGTGMLVNADSSINGWRSGSSYAEWASIKIKPGDYYLEFEYLMTENPQTTSGGIHAEETAVLEFFEVSQLADSSQNRRSFELNLSSSAEEWTSLKVGPVRYTRSPVTLRLIGSEGYPNNQIRLRNIRLTPQVAEQPPSGVEPASVGSPNAPLTRAREGFSNDLKLAYEPVLAAHLEKLNSLMEQYPEWQKFIRSEVNQAEQRKALMIERGRADLPRPMASFGGIVGFQDLEGVNLVEHPENTGDRLRLRHDGREFAARLLWVRCADPMPTPQQENDNPFAKHFGIDPDDAVLFGRAAKDFSDDYLRGKVFRVLARNVPEADGEVPVLIFLPEVGLFQNILLDQGLAALDIEINRDAGTLERALMRSVADRAAAARRRSPRPGAWALSTLPVEPAK